MLAGVARVRRGDGRFWNGDARPRFAAGRARRARRSSSATSRTSRSSPTTAGDVRFYDDLVKDKKVVLTFVSSRAPADSTRSRGTSPRSSACSGRGSARTCSCTRSRATPSATRRAMLQRLGGVERRRPGLDVPDRAAADVETLRRSLGFGSDDPAEDAEPGFLGRPRPLRRPSPRCAGRTASRRRRRACSRTRWCSTSAPGPRRRVADHQDVRDGLRPGHGAGLELPAAPLGI